MGTGSGAINGFNFEFGVDPDFDNSAVIGIPRNPNCQLRYMNRPQK